MFHWAVCSMQLLYDLAQKYKAQGILMSTNAFAWKKLFREWIPNNHWVLLLLSHFSRV